MRRWPFLEVAADTFSITVSDPEYTFTDIDATCGHVDAIGIQDGSERIELDFVQAPTLRRRERLFNETGTPDSWTRIGTAIRLYPNPDRALTGVADYVRKATEMAADGDNTVLPDDYADILVWGAVADIAIRQRDYDTHQWAKGLFNEQLREMMNEYGVAQRQNATEVVRTGEIDTVNRHIPNTWPVY
jgi:hypothetical protein